ncbi:MAG: DUF454 domain-containing protein [Alphaproteobacteria bacterium]|jgi:uncharacterized membrane protein YbaN (DUF454 family)|nr:DUF454 domain-containing protein [Alphaproteobacteria bacterium]
MSGKSPLSKTSWISRPVWFAIGWIFVVLAALGAILPLLPTAPFLIIAAIAFSKSSERCRQWLYNQPLFGPILTEWEEHGVIPRGAKVIALISMTLSFAALLISGKVPVWALVIVGIFLLACGWFVASRPSKKAITNS